MIFLVEDNGYAISVPIEAQTAGGSISRLVEGFPGLFRQEVDGTDFLASYRAMKAAAAYCREGRGPALVHAHVIRPYSHSLSDDERLYKTTAERHAEAERDPVIRFPKFLVEEGILDRQRCSASRTRSTKRCTTPRQRAAREPPAPATAHDAPVFRNHRSRRPTDFATRAALSRRSR